MIAHMGLVLRAQPARDRLREEGAQLIAGRLGVQAHGLHPDPGDPGVISGWTGPH